LPTSTSRGLRRVAALCCVAAGAALLSACSEAQVTHPTAQASQTPIVLATLPPIGFNHRYGNNPVAAADAFAMERKLFAGKQYWEIGLRADPAAAGYVDETNPTATAGARARFTDMLLIIASESLPTLRALLQAGDAGQQAYCEQLVEQLRAQGYSGLQKATVAVFFGESDRHAELTWTKSGGYAYKILDNNLNGALLTPIPTATPFVTPVSH
jgi:hypothetical protein